jgi:MoaA/NifB/PqqE/SkfB family radical SAM enzyme
MSAPGGFGNRLSWRLANLRFASRYPKLAPKLAKCYARVFAGQRVLRGVEFAITYECNFTCEHCLKDRLIDSERPEMTADQIVHAAKDLERLGAIFINYTGGEPILREDLIEIVEQTARLRGAITTVASNAFSLDRDKINDLAKAGVAMFTFSLDGPTATQHDAFRGVEGSFDRVLSAIGNARSAGVPALLNAVVTSEGLRDGSFAQLADLAAKLDCMLTLNLPYPVGGWEGKDLLLSEEDYRAYVALLQLPHVRWEGSSNWLREGCPAGTEKVYVTPYGDVFPCAVIHDSYGNLLEEPIADIHQRMGKVACFDGRRKPCLVAEAPEMLANLPK